MGSPCPRPGPRGPPLAVNEVLGAAAGLDDATALLDAAAVAGLPDGLRERVEHLLGQLVQVGAAWVCKGVCLMWAARAGVRLGVVPA